MPKYRAKVGYRIKHNGTYLSGVLEDYHQRSHDGKVQKEAELEDRTVIEANEAFGVSYAGRVEVLVKPTKGKNKDKEVWVDTMPLASLQTNVPVQARNQAMNNMDKKAMFPGFDLGKALPVLAGR